MCRRVSFGAKSYISITLQHPAVKLGEANQPRSTPSFYHSIPPDWKTTVLALPGFGRALIAVLARNFDSHTGLDSYGSHVMMEYGNYCDQNKVLLILFPPHSTRTLQLLDDFMSKRLSTAYSNELSAFLDHCQRISSLAKRDFFTLFQE
jgi:hypothetical protein